MARLLRIEYPGAYYHVMNRAGDDYRKAVKAFKAIIALK